MLKAIANRLGLVSRLRAAWNADIDRSTKELRNDIARLARAVERLSDSQQLVCDRAARMEQHAVQIKQAFRLNDRQHAMIATLDARLDAGRVIAHVHNAIERAPLLTDPFPHIVVEQILPEDLYALAVDAIPPATFFTERDPIKQDLRIPIEFGPTLAARVWDFIDAVVARDAIRPAALRKFHVPLQRHYNSIFGPEFRERANALPQAPSGGRLMLRRPGYHLAPHRDPKRTMLTCLMYLPTGQDSEAYGTKIFRVLSDGESSYTQTYYPEDDGRTCELVKVVPCRSNSALIFLNSQGAHGADIPADASRKVERYAYQFYIGPAPASLNALIQTLPPERRAMWRSKTELEVTGM